MISNNDFVACIATYHIILYISFLRHCYHPHDYNKPEIFNWSPKFSLTRWYHMPLFETDAIHCPLNKFTIFCNTQIHISMLYWCFRSIFFIVLNFICNLEIVYVLLSISAICFSIISSCSQILIPLLDFQWMLLSGFITLLTGNWYQWRRASVINGVSWYTAASCNNIIQNKFWHIMILTKIRAWFELYLIKSPHSYITLNKIDI